jgi:uncharacterized membrane protein YdjX (TVP38/TMEM64 family)
MLMMAKRNLVVFGFIAIACLSISVITGAIATDPVFAQDSLNVQNLNNFNPQELLRQALKWIENLGYIGGFVFILVYIIATVAFIPGSVLTLGAGVVFGVVWGSLYVLIGATLGAIAAFLIGRYLARDWISQKIAENQKFAAINRAMSNAGFKIVLLTRLSPIFPFNFLNYAFGVTGISLKDYVIASVGMVPGTVMYVYIGSLASDLAVVGHDNPSKDITQWIIRIVGFIATVAVTIYVTDIARKALDKEVSE